MNYLTFTANKFRDRLVSCKCGAEKFEFLVIKFCLVTVSVTKLDRATQLLTFDPIALKIVQ